VSNVKRLTRWPFLASKDDVSHLEDCSGPGKGCKGPLTLGQIDSWTCYAHE